jgi:hypothetical protein
MLEQACGTCEAENVPLLFDFDEGHNIAYCRQCTEEFQAYYAEEETEKRKKRKRTKPCKWALELQLLEQTRECARQLGVNLDGDHEEAEMMLKMRGKAAMVAGGTPFRDSPYVHKWSQWARTVVSNDVSSAPSHGAMQHFLLQLRGALASAPALAHALAPAPASA